MRIRIINIRYGLNIIPLANLQMALTKQEL